jgi:anaerobic magnesium-protoporphyrin IX monomethyl ester cyclase
MPIPEHLQKLSHIPKALPVVGKGEFKFVLDPKIKEPSQYRVAFVILLDGDLVMSPEHLGVALMASVLREAQFSARIFEVAHGREDQALKNVCDYDPVFVCFTLMSLNVLSCQQFCRLLRLRKPDVVIACGGPAGTYASIEVLKQIPEADIVAIGEGEPTIFELVQRLCLEESLENCAGICFRASDGKIIQNSTRPLMHNLDDLPFAARDQFEMHGSRLEYMRVSTTRGCVARCTFCSAPNISNKFQHGKAWRGRSPKSVLDEIEYLVKKYNFRTYDFIDSTFEDPDGGEIGKARVAAIAKGMLDRKLDIYYNCCMRAENWSEDDENLLALLVESGLEKVNVGIESGTPWELKLWDKLATVEDNIRIIKLLRRHGIYLAMGFIQFHPYSTVDSLKSNAAFLRDYSGHNLRRLTERLEIYPGTVIVAKMQQDGLLDDDYFQTLNPYGYKFRDERVQKLAVHFASMYNNSDYHEKGVITEQSSVFRFETFNVVLETFISRLRRRFRHVPEVKEELDNFTAQVYALRREVAQFNHAFFLNNLEAVLNDRFDARQSERQVEEIETLFTSTMDRIRTLQLKTGRKLMRAGADVSQISSSIKVPDQGGAPRTYTGGAPCW